MKRLFFIFLFLFSGVGRSAELPDSLGDYVKLIRPQIIYDSKGKNYDNQYDMPANAFPFDVSHDGNALVFHVPSPEIVGIKGDKVKITRILELNQSLVTCANKTNWEIFQKGWYYRYRIHDLKRNFYTSITVKEKMCQFLEEAPTDEVLRFITKELKDNLPYSIATSDWIDFNADKEKVEYVWQTNVETFDQFQAFPEDGKKRVLDYLAMLAMKQICVGVRHNFFFERELVVKNVYLTRDMRVLRDIQLSKDDCVEIRQHFRN